MTEPLERLTSDYGLLGIGIVLLIGVIALLWRELRASYARERATYRETMESNAAIRAALEALTISIENRNPLVALVGEAQRETLAGIARLMESMTHQANRGAEDRARAFDTLQRIESKLDRAGQS